MGPEGSSTGIQPPPPPIRPEPVEVHIFTLQTNLTIILPSTLSSLEVSDKNSAFYFSNSFSSFYSSWSCHYNNITNSFTYEIWNLPSPSYLAQIRATASCLHLRQDDEARWGGCLFTHAGISTLKQWRVSPLALCIRIPRGLWETLTEPEAGS
jgi:hypothetical protein